ncbi:extracellular solute-binding protein [Candidatus Leptofilum sp.]|uniref:extracellular solute-binding protein n=1 Tax=Candidatus Leptofilum sp. TaxID=3241576 RepID=UPI003B59EAEE
MNKKVSLLLIMLLLIMAGCDLANSFNQTSPEETDPNATDSETAVATSTPATDTTPDIAIPSTPITDTRPSLRVWLPPEIAIPTDAGAAVLNAQLATFRNNNPDLDLTIEQKSVSGQSGILNYLRTGRAVAPDILPDLVAIPIDQLGLAQSEELVYPLGGLIETSLLEDLYPAALNLVLEENQVGGYPFVLTGLPHLAYNSRVVTDTISSSWQLFAEQPYSFVFPANGIAGSKLGLQLYLAAGGTLVNDAGQQALQLQPLTAALEQLLIAENLGLILDQSSNYVTLQETWPLLQAGTASVALTNSEQFLQQRDADGVFQATAVPGLDRQLTPLVSGWAWAISTADPTQRELAAALLNALIESQNLGEWSYASGYLPARQAAFMFWPDDDSYKAFASGQLSQASPLPISPGSNLMTILNNAVFDVITLTKSPQTAAEEAVAALQQ